MGQITYLCGPPGGGKSSLLAERYRRAVREAGSDSVLWLAPDAATAAGVRDRVVTAAGGLYDPRLFTFPALANALLNANHETVAGLEPCQRTLLAGEVARRPEVGFPPALVARPGFIRALCAFVDELKRAAVDPRDFTATLTRVFPGEGRAIALARFYDQYQGLLTEQHLFDEPGLFWWARHLLSTGRCAPLEAVQLVLVDGFTDFTTTQLQVLYHLARRADETLVTLPLLESDERADLFAAPARLLERLRSEVGEGRVERLEACAGRPAPLCHLIDNLFLLQPRERVEPAGAIALIAAPGVLAEVREVLREVKTLLLDGVRPEEIGLVFRTLEPYRRALLEVARETGVPLALAGEEPVTARPSVQVVLDLLAVPLRDYRQADVVKLLKSNFINAAALAPGAAAAPGGEVSAEEFEAVACAARVLGGREGWPRQLDLYARRLAYESDLAAGGGGEDEETEGFRDPLAIAAESAALARCRALFLGLADRLAALECEQRRAEHVRALADLLDELDLAGRLVHPDACPEMAANIAAYEALIEALGALADADRRLPTATPIPFAAFAAEVASLAAETLYRLPLRTEGHVVALDVHGARQVRRPYLFLGGLVESVWPQVRGEKPFFDDRERLRLQRAGLALDLAGDLQREEAYLFYLACAAAERRLTFSYPTVDSEGRPLLRSHYVDEALGVFAGGSVVPRQRLLSDVLVRPAEAACPRELLETAVAADQALWDGYAVAAPPAVARRAEHVFACAEVERRRTSREPLESHDGVLADPALLARLAQRYGPQYQWSATALGTYGGCPFRFFVGRVLGLETVEAPGEEVEALDYGNAVHRILQRFFTRWQEQHPEGGLRETDGAAARQAMGRAVDEVFAGREQQGLVTHRALWQLAREQARRDLLCLVGHEVAEMGPYGLVPHAFECRYQALLPPGGQGEALHIRGKIDRVDVDPHPAAGGEPAVRRLRLQGRRGDAPERHQERLGFPDALLPRGCAADGAGGPRAPGPLLALGLLPLPRAGEARARRRRHRAGEGPRGLRRRRYRLRPRACRQHPPRALPGQPAAVRRLLRLQAPLSLHRRTRRAEGRGGGAGMRLPADQPVRDRAATAIDTSIFLDAGAGCGKTQALTERYLQLLEAGVAVREIAAVTFTNKAARDMKARLRERCEERARAAASEAEAVVWRTRARELESAPISTIHSFCTNLLRRYAVGAGLDPQFSLMDEIQQRLLLAQTIRESLLQRLDAEEGSAALVISELGLAEAGAAISRLLAAREDHDEALRSPPTTAGLLADWEARHGAIQAERLRLLTCSSAWREAVATLRDHPSEEPGHAVDLQRLSALDFADAAAASALPLAERLDALRNLLGIGKTSGARGGWGDPEVRKLVTEALACLKNTSGSVGGQLPALLAPFADEEGSVEQAADLTAAIYLEAHYALAAFTAAKQDASLLDFEDVQIMARDLLRDHEAVRRDCHERLRQMLVDEFQDTNRLQKELLWLAAGGEPGEDPPPGRLFVVGDAKQSIYRFRDADVTVFDETRHEFATAPGCAQLRLEVTFRAHPQVAELHNTLFDTAALMGPDRDGRAPYEAFYEPLAPHRESPAGPPPCDLLLVAGAAEERSYAEQLRTWEGLALAEWLKGAIGKLTVYEWDKASGGELARPARAGDFAILFRSTSNLRLYERALRLHGLPYYVSAGRGFFTRQEILDLMNLLSALENWRDEVALAGALRSPLFGLSDETLYWLKAERLPLFEGLRNAAEGRLPAGAVLPAAEEQLVRFAWAEFSALRDLKNRLPISTLIAEILDRTGYTAAVAGLFGGEQMISNLRKLVELARGFETLGSYSLRDFVDYLRTLVVSEERMGQAAVEEESADCVKLLTIHAAKGLEWPVVIVPDLGRGDLSRGSNGWRYHVRFGLVAAPRVGDERLWPPLGLLMADLDDAEDEAESRRLLYVAATRCRDHLVLSSAVGVQSRERGRGWLDWLGAAVGLDRDEARARLAGVAVSRCAGEDFVEPRPVRVDRAGGLDVPPAEVLRRRVEAVAPDLAGLRRFSVTALSSYLRCPACYRLRYLEGLPDRPLAGLLRDTGQQLSSLERGSLVHRCLEIIGSRGLTAAEQALQTALKVRDLPAAGKDRIMAMLQWYLEGDLYRRRVQPAERLRSEMPLWFGLGGALIEGKLDAVAEHEDGRTLDVLDYKTGYEQDEEGQAEHRFQLGLYCAGLELVERRVRSATVVYLDARQVLELAPEDGAAARDSALAAVAGIRAGRFDPRAGTDCGACRLAWACTRQCGG